MLQFILSIILTLCVLTEVIVHIFRGNINTVGGYIVSAFFVITTSLFIRFSYKEMKDNN